MSSCPQFFSESDRAAGNYEDYCQPEEEVNCEFSNRQVQALLETRYPRPTNIAAEQGSSHEPTGDKETVSDIKERETDDTVRLIM